MTLSNPQETLVSTKVCKSLGLNALLKPVRNDRSYSILDLGRPLQDNVRFWSKFSCWLHIPGFCSSYREWKEAVGEGKETKEPAYSGLLPFSDETVFDIILAWDLFNYFDLKELKVLIQRLSHWCRPGTRLFALISILPNISVSPMVFRILSREQMLLEVPSQEKRPCPRHQPRDIARLMARFTISCSYLSRHGIQEYVFKFR